MTSGTPKPRHIPCRKHGTCVEGCRSECNTGRSSSPKTHGEKSMILNTPVLTLSANSGRYAYGLGLGWRRQAWICGSELGRLFVKLPPKIILSGSTRPSVNAVKVRLMRGGHGYSIDRTEAGSHKGFVMIKMVSFARKFREAGHHTIYISLYEVK